MRKKTVRDVGVAGKRVLVRVDFNVPQDKAGAITDDTRIRASLPTIQYLKEAGARVILCSHLGRPDGKVVESMRLAPVAVRLAQLLRSPVTTAPDCVGAVVERAVGKMREGDVLLLENLRFHPGEEENNAGFAGALAGLADLYVNDAFGTAHRAHASTVGVASYLPAVAGFLMQREIEFLSQALEAPVRPFSAVVGGAKVKDKLGLLENIVDKVDSLLIGGGMVAAFLRAQSIVQDASQGTAGEETLVSVGRVLELVASRNVRLLLPVDVIVASSADAPGTAREVDVEKVPKGWSIVDIGARTVKLFAAELEQCKTVLWNGPMGIFEIPRFSEGTKALATVIAGLKATTIIGGGSTAEAVENLGLASKMSHVSTGGGASLMFLEGQELPGVAVLLDK
ncbi:MAG: phosphoglycerate kinase [Chloroflexi bacterium]|nr:phosphoglycerate kinase [Chloroflexota bacterium]